MIYCVVGLRQVPLDTRGTMVIPVFFTTLYLYFSTKVKDIKIDCDNHHPNFGSSPREHRASLNF